MQSLRWLLRRRARRHIKPQFNPHELEPGRRRPKLKRPDPIAGERMGFLLVVRFGPVYGICVPGLPSRS